MWQGGFLAKDEAATGGTVHEGDGFDLQAAVFIHHLLLGGVDGMKHYLVAQAMAEKGYVWCQQGLKLGVSVDV